MAGFVIKRWPKTDGELHAFVKNVLGVNLPTEQICDDHVAPFDAFAEAFFAKTSMSMWLGSRGLGGKSYALATLAAAEALILGAEINVLGGSYAQSLRVNEVFQSIWEYKNAPKGFVVTANKDYTKLRNGAVVKALLASSRSVRGPHPSRLRLDEADEMEMDILDGALGQPMATPTIPLQVVLSSTHQYPDGTVTSMLKRASEQGWPVHKWCWRESMGTEKNPGWLTQKEVDFKRSIISKEAWRVEFDMQEPSFEGRAIDTESVERMFTNELTRVPGDNGKYYEFEKPDPEGRYVTGADWAQARDNTVIVTYRADVEPWRMVAFLRVNKQPWPTMVGYANKRLRDYGGVFVYDHTGLGAVVGDFLDINERLVEVIPFDMIGRKREALFSEYISGIEGDNLRAPRIDYTYSEHLYVTSDDLLKGHPPDSFVAGAMAWQARNLWLSRISPPPPIEILRAESPWRQ